MPPPTTLRTRARTSAVSSGESPSEGSSSKRRRGALISARPTASICCCPPESCQPSAEAFSASTGKRACTASMRLRVAPGSRLATSRFSRTVMPGNTRRPSGA